MEKRKEKKLSTSRKYKLPTLPESKSQLHSLMPHIPQISSSTDRLKDLRKIYFQYKSNANILANSPYFSNRQQQKQVIALLNSNRYELTKKKQEEISNFFRISEGFEDKYNNRQKFIVKIRMAVLNQTVQFEKQVSTVEELIHKLKIEYAFNEYKLTGNTKKSENIIGFQTVNQDIILDYLLSIKNIQLSNQKIYIKPIFKLIIKGKVRLDHFKLIRCLGSGGFSLVYLVRDNWNGQYYALKLINKSFILQSQRQTIVQNQRYVLGQLNSPFITQLKFCFQTKNHFAFMIQYCPGGQLFYQLKKVKKMTENQAKFYFLEILIGLDYIHQKNIIYRDLKPQNLLIAVDGHVKIADFGLAKPLISDSRKVAYSFCGSPQYMAPQMLQKSGHTFTLDYYCLGALLYQLVLGIPPYYSLNHEQIYKGILHEQLTFPSHTPLSQEIKSLLKGLLQKNPNKRLGHLFGVKQILIHPWVGKINRKVIEQKRLIPPFLPDLSTFNFDQSDLKQKSAQISQKIEEDLQNPRFETHFSNLFYFQSQGALIRQKQNQSRIIKHRKQHSKSKQNRQLARSLETKSKALHRIMSQRSNIHI